MQIATFWDIYSINQPIYIICTNKNQLSFYELCMYIYIPLTRLYFHWGCYDWKSLKMCPFSNIIRPKSSFLNIFQKNFHKWTKPILFFLSSDTKHLIYKNFHFVRRKVPEKLRPWCQSLEGNYKISLEPAIEAILTF